MKSEPLVSVVVPAYNAERFIERTLRSVLRQTYRNLEILIIDDGSTDNTRALSRTVVGDDARVRIISIPNGGVAKARNTGIEVSAGAFVAFLDADDLWHPTKIERQLLSLTNGNGDGAAAAYTRHRVIDIDDRVMSEARGFACSGYTLSRHLYAKFVGNGSSLLVRREAAVAVGGFDSSWAARGIGGCEDLDFELKIAARYPLVAVPHYLLGYRVYPGNMSSNKLRMARAIRATVDHHIRLNPGLPGWAASKARGSTNEYALCLLLGDRHWKLVSAEFARLLRNDLSRGLEFAATLVRRKISKTMNGTQVIQAVDAGAVYFDDLSPDSVANLPGAASGWRDRAYMKRLERLDAILARKLGLPTQ